MMNSIKTDRRQQLRKVAILVATLEESLAERLLADLPAREAAEVEAIVDQLESIDPAEYREVVADFRRGLDNHSRPQTTAPQASKLDGVELDESLLARMAAQEDAAELPVTRPGAWNALGDADADTLAEMLSAEQPQTIAVVLSRLEPDRGAELVAKFSPPLQAEVLTRLADLDPADQQTVQVVESQLATWIAQQRQRQQRMAAGRDLVERILQSSPEHQRAAMLTQLSKRNLTLAAELTARSSTGRTVAPKIRSPVSYQPSPSVEVAKAEIRSAPTTDSSDPLSELEALDDQALLTALRHADRQVVMMALAGASGGLMKRILRGLPRRQANQFRQQVRAVGPTRLSDMLAAQCELVRCAQASATH